MTRNDARARLARLLYNHVNRHSPLRCSLFWIDMGSLNAQSACNRAIKADYSSTGGSVAVEVVLGIARARGGI